MYDIYLRVSQLGDRSEDEATEVYEAQCREWAVQNGVDGIDEVEEDTDVSGSVAVADRKLERLIQKVEAGESEGILTPYLDRFGRDLIEGALAYRRIKLAGGRLVCTKDGIDSSRPGDEFQFQIRMVIAEDYLRRARANFQAGIEKSAKKGFYLAGRAPFGYRRRDQVEALPEKDATLVVDDAEAELVRECFRRRAAGASIGKELVPLCAEAGYPLTKAGIAGILKNRAYLGESRVQSDVKGRPKVLKHTHEPLVTSTKFEAAQAANGTYHPRPGLIAKQAKLLGIVHCATCEKRCRVAPYGKNKDKTTYVCTNPACTAHAGMAARKLDGYVELLLMQAIMDREPHIGAVIEGDTRYSDALAAVEEAQRLHDEWRDNSEAQAELGWSGYVAGLRARRERLALARKQLSAVRPPRENRKQVRMTYEEFLEDYDRERAARLIDRVVIKPAGRVGKAVPPTEDRVEVYLAGADEPYRPKYTKNKKLDKLLAEAQAYMVSDEWKRKVAEHKAATPADPLVA
jgi:DNA invertase Pin-like site-specific DNA recombinase